MNLIIFSEEVFKLYWKQFVGKELAQAIKVKHTPNCLTIKLLKQQIPSGPQKAL